MEIRLTAARLIVIRELSSGPKRWGQLQKAYYGEGRSALKVNTSFWNQLQKCQELKIVKHDPVNHSYELDEVGRQLLDHVHANNISMDVKSEAQLKWEMENPQA